MLGQSPEGSLSRELFEYKSAISSNPPALDMDIDAISLPYDLQRIPNQQTVNFSSTFPDVQRSASSSYTRPRSHSDSKALVPSDVAGPTGDVDLMVQVRNQAFEKTLRTGADSLVLRFSPYLKFMRWQHNEKRIRQLLVELRGMGYDVSLQLCQENYNWLRHGWVEVMTVDGAVLSRSEDVQHKLRNKSRVRILRDMARNVDLAMRDIRQAQVSPTQSKSDSGPATMANTSSSAKSQPRKSSGISVMRSVVLRRGSSKSVPPLVAGV